MAAATSRPRYYTTAQLSDRISETPEGFLCCRDVPIARAGQLIYQPQETPITPSGKGPTVVYRLPKDLHDPSTLASFESKPITLNHPEAGASDDGFVGPDNWRELAVGVVQNVRAGFTDDGMAVILGDLLVTDREAVDAVLAKRLRQVSLGYDAEFVEVSPGVGRQERILGNHVALVEAGRCGPECAIFDSAPQQEKTTMTARQKIAAFFGRALDAMPEAEASAFARRIADEMPTEAEVTVTTDEDVPDMAAKLAALEARIAALESAATVTDEVPDPSAAATDPAGDPPPPADSDSPPVAAADPVSAKLDALLAAVAKLIGMETAEAAAEAGEGEPAAEGMIDAAPCMDAETVARAEILAPGIAKVGDLKARALDAAYATTEGRKVIDSLLGGKPLASADKDLVFAAAAEVVRKARAATINNASRVTLDSLPGMKPGPMTPEQINEQNARRYGLTH
jgi:hypothetical protein